MITAAAETAVFAPVSDANAHLSTVVIEDDVIAEISVWEHSRFANHFRSVLHNRAERAAAEGANDDLVSGYRESVDIMDRAIRAQDIDMIVAYHQYILDAENPGAVETALHVLKPMTNGKKVCSVITKEHISACARITESFAVRHGMITAECHDLITLSFYNLSRTSEIVDLLEQGITSSQEITDILAPRQTVAARFARS